MQLVPSSFISQQDLMPTRHTRAVRQQLARMETLTELQIRGVENASDVQASILGALGHVAKRAMFVVGAVSQTEQQVAQLVPLATSRLQAIGEMTALVAAELVGDAADRLRRA